MHTILFTHGDTAVPKNSPASFAQTGTASPTALDRGLQPNAASAAIRAIVRWPKPPT